MRVTYHTWPYCSTSRANQALRLLANAGFQNRGVCLQAFPSFPFPSPLFHFLALVSFLARSKPKIPFLGLFFAPKLNGNACYAGYRFSCFPLSSKTNISKFQCDQDSGRRGNTLWMCYLQIIIIYLYIYLFSLCPWWERQTFWADYLTFKFPSFCVPVYFSELTRTK